MKRIHLVTDDGLHDRKAFYEVTNYPAANYMF